MATGTASGKTQWDWLRVGAWSGSVAAHAVALLLVALPMTMPRIPRTPAPPIDVRWIETPPPPPLMPEPPPPAVPQRVRVPAPPRASTPVVHETTPIQTPVAADVPSDPAPVSTPVETPAASDLGTGGATQELAYASPVRPRYPPGSARAREQGTVILRVLVDESGVPQQVDIEKSSGHARLDNAAREAVAHARFRPVLRNGTAVPAWGRVPIAFRLDNG